MNADEIAKSLHGFEGVPLDIRASRFLLKKVSAFESEHHSFALETNLANKALLQRIHRLQESGYMVTLIFLWLPSVDLAIDRVMERVRRGGHSVPAEVIRRRYRTGMSNFFNIYRQVVDSWLFFDNSHLGQPRLLASKADSGEEVALQPHAWKILLNGRDHHGKK